MQRPNPGSRQVASLSLRAATKGVSVGAASGASAAGDALGLTSSQTSSGQIPDSALVAAGGVTTGGVSVGGSSGPLAVVSGSAVCVQVQNRKLMIHVRGKQLRALIDNKSSVETGAPVFVEVEALDQDDDSYKAKAYFGLAHKPADMLSRREKNALKKSKKAAAASAAAAGEDEVAVEDIQADPIFCFILHVPSNQGELGLHTKNIKSAKFRDAKKGFFGRMVQFDNDYELYDGSILGTEHAYYFETPDISKFGDDVAPDDAVAVDDDSDDGESSSSDDKKKTKVVKEDHVILIVEGDVVVPVYDPTQNLNVISVGSGGSTVL